MAKSRCSTINARAERRGFSSDMDERSAPEPHPAHPVQSSDGTIGRPRRHLRQLGRHRTGSAGPQSLARVAESRKLPQARATLRHARRLSTDGTAGAANVEADNPRIPTMVTYVSTNELLCLAPVSVSSHASRNLLPLHCISPGQMRGGHQCGLLRPRVRRRVRHVRQRGHGGRRGCQGRASLALARRPQCLRDPHALGLAQRRARHLEQLRRRRGPSHVYTCNATRQPSLPSR